MKGCCSNCGKQEKTIRMIPHEGSIFEICSRCFVDYSFFWKVIAKGYTKGVVH